MDVMILDQCFETEDGSILLDVASPKDSEIYQIGVASYANMLLL